jgi:hypothetical protein
MKVTRRQLQQVLRQQLRVLIAENKYFEMGLASAKRGPTGDHEADMGYWDDPDDMSDFGYDDYGYDDYDDYGDITERRMETDVFQIVTRSLIRGPRSHQQLLANVLDVFPNTSDEVIDGHIDRLEDSGQIIFDPSIQKYR